MARSSKPRGPSSTDDIRVTRMHVGGDEYVVISVPTGDSPADTLTDAERDVARQVVAGLSKKQIARRRDSSVNTVANQVASIYLKLDVRSRAELVARWSGRL